MSQQINLFNPIFLKTKKVFSAVALFQTFGLVLLGATLVGMFASYQSIGLKKNAEIVSAQLLTAQTQVAKLRAMAGNTAVNSTLENSLAKLESDIKNRQKIATVLQKSDFGITKGYSSYLAAFARQIPSGLWLTGFTIDGGGNDISLQGRSLQAELVPVYVNQLKLEPTMQGKSFSALEIHLPQNASSAVQGKSEGGKQLSYAPYIEFNLHSSDAAEKNNSSGVKGK